MPLYEYGCRACGRVREELRPSGTSETPCECGGTATRRPSRFALTNAPTGAGLRSQYRLFQEATQEIDHAYTKAEADLERSLPGPGLWPAAKQRAQAMIAAGEAPAVAPLTQ